MQIRKVLLQRPKICGGMALLNFQPYYWAANFRALLYWLRVNREVECPSWLDIESKSCGASSLSALLCSPLPLTIPSYCQNPVVKGSLKIWSQFRKYFGLSCMSLSTPVVSNHLFPAAQGDSSFQRWENLDTTSIKTLYKDNIFNAFLMD